jgi:hypothetical protein
MDKSYASTSPSLTAQYCTGAHPLQHIIKKDEPDYAQSNDSSSIHAFTYCTPLGYHSSPEFFWWKLWRSSSSIRGGQHRPPTS